MPLAYLGRVIARYLSGPSRVPYASTPSNFDAFRDVVRPGDVVLVDGRQRVSTAIKYLTQSTWSHAALCVDADFPRGAGAFVEADALEGVRLVKIRNFEGLHVRICRPVGIDSTAIGAVCRYAMRRIGHEYDLRNVIDLARYLLPIPPVPAGWRRRMIALGSGEPTKAICSSLIAEAFEEIRYPILPRVTQVMRDDPDCAGCIEEIFHIRHHSLFTPRDFDVSPYFQIIKAGLDERFNPATLRWE